MRTIPMKSSLLFWRDQSGAEVDWIIEKQNNYIPIEVKWTKNPSKKDARHINTFIKEYPNSFQGYLICRIPIAQKLTDRVIALPWKELHVVLESS